MPDCNAVAADAPPRRCGALDKNLRLSSPALAGLWGSWLVDLARHRSHSLPSAKAVTVARHSFDREA